jgi:hypothetical protein
MGFGAFSPPVDPGYRILDPMPWETLIGPIAAAEDALARLDERLAKSPIRDGWIARSHFSEACASLWLDGELVHLEDLVLHDSMMDVRAPTAELVRAHAVLRTGRRIAKAEPGWALTKAGLDALRGRQSTPEAATPEKIAIDQDWGEGASDEGAGDDEWSRALAAVDAVVARSEKVLAGEATERPSREDRPSLIYDLDWDEDARLAEWRRILEATEKLPPTLAAAIALDAWNEIQPLQTQGWHGRLLAADLLRSRGKTSLAVALSTGLKAAAPSKRWSRDRITRVLVILEAITQTALDRLKEHDRLMLTRSLLERRAGGRRSNSRIPALLELMLQTPLASAEMISVNLKVTPRAALMMARELGLRETTGRSRYRAWAI